MIELPLHPWINYDPNKYVTRLERSAYKQDLLSKISFIAIAAITLSVLAASFFLSAPTTTISFFLLLPVVATPIFAWGSSKFQEKNRELQEIINQEKPVALAFEKIKDWEDSKILAFLAAHKIRPPENIFLPHLLPLIARFQARWERIEHSLKESNRLLQSKNFTERDLRIWQRNIGWNIKERKILPAAIECAFVLQILKNPTLQGTISDYFTLVQKSFEERQFDRLYDADDTYLLFLQKKEKALTMETLLQNLDPDALSKLLFER